MSDWVNRVLEAMRVPGMPRVYVLGSFERRVTIYSQQVRALNLVDALWRGHELHAGDEVAVVGAGAAGLTFAAGAAKRGARVTVLETEGTLLPRFRDDVRRWLHPRVYDWPQPGWHHDRAGLPVLDWTAGTIADVRAQQLAGWNAVTAEMRDRLRVILHATRMRLSGGSRDTPPTLSWNAPASQGAKGPGTFARVILAVGFGVEKSDVPEYRGYWEPDDIDVVGAFRRGIDKPKTWMVSGCGDGALTDLLRLCVTDFRHEHMVRDFVSDRGIGLVEEQIRAIERDARVGNVHNPEFLFEQYRTLRCEPVIDALMKRARVDTKVTLNTNEAYLLQGNSSALNRFLVAQLWHADRFETLTGKVKPPVERDRTRLKVSFEDGSNEFFDRVLLRHGPRTAALEAFPTVWTACTAMRERWKQAPTLLDQTRDRYWDPDAFGPEERFETPHAVPPHASTTSLAPTSPSTPPAWMPRFEHVLERAQHFHGRVEQLELLARWFDDPHGTQRVMSLCAIGGTGKTALAARALDEWFAKHGGVDHAQPGGVFVWSFYENERVDEFLGAACAYLVGEAGTPGGRAERLKDALRKVAPHLLVLDGMERVQAEGGAGRARGEIEDQTLRTLLRLIAAGHLGTTRVLITTRFSVCDLNEAGHREIQLDDLDAPAARAVLRAWKLRGDDATLDRLAERVRFHALSVRVMGAYVGQFRGGDATAGLSLDLGIVAHDLSDADRKARKLDGLIGHYANAMSDDERALMARLSLFQRGVAVDLLAMVVDAGGKVAGVLVGRDHFALLMLLERLVWQGLAFAYGDGVRRVYTAHPFLRDAFRKLVDVPAEQVHEALRARLSPGLEARPGTPPSDDETLDRYERLIEVTRLAGRVEDAFDLYWDGMGGYDNLGHRLGENTRGARILAAFARHDSLEHLAPELPPHYCSRAVCDWGAFSGDLGDLRFCLRCFEEAVHITRLADDARGISNSLQNVVEANVLRGHLSSAAPSATEALTFAKKANDSNMSNCSHSLVGQVAVLRGEPQLARDHFAEATRLEGQPLYSLRGVREAEFRARVGNRGVAHTLCEQNLVICEQNGWRRDIARLHTLLGHLVLPRELVEARRHLALAHDWARKSGNVEVVLRAHLLAADIALHAGDPVAARHEASEGRTLADVHEFGLYAIDLRLALVRSHLASREYDAALAQANEALTLSTHAECGYVWGEANALHIAGLALRDLKRRDEALAHFERAATLRARIEHPGAADSLAEADHLRA